MLNWETVAIVVVALGAIDYVSPVRLSLRDGLMYTAVLAVLLWAVCCCGLSKQSVMLAQVGVAVLVVLYVHWRNTGRYW